MANVSELSAGIMPGSLPHGDRASLEAGLSSAVSSPTGAPAPTAAPPMPMDNTDDPLAALLSGDITLPPGGQPTDGLSVGAGPGPLPKPEESPKTERLRWIAEQATSPTLRALAMRELRKGRK